MKFRILIHADINIDDKNFTWNSIDDAREVATLIAEETIKYIKENCNTGAYNFNLNGIEWPGGKIDAKHKKK